ncbi:type I cytoskeletal 47 kDa-like isoform X1 [Labeo rohita]|uniref:Type I cytoskeletal 47 kDa-like isoform X1 n=1 Tax=Labeo rohita TaxID=84645 RepID=A0A498M162_LABRO|nr:keratin, type I cytoskeletal 47 kDa [Labeo rohita]RXN14569.1 type I cytoskeletal 47 kDa-like isoform X1 [Labeo rohita]
MSKRSSRSYSVATGRSLAPVSFSSYGQTLLGGGLQSGAGLGFRSGAGLGFGSGAGLGFGSGAGLGFGSGGALGFGSGAGLGFGSGAGSGSGSGFGAGGGSASYRMVGGTFAAGGGGGSAGAGFRAGGGSLADAMSNVINEKQQLQVLNDRLAAYLEKVKRLETTNLELNDKLKAFSVNQVRSTLNLEPYEIQIKPLREKLLQLIQDHARIALAVDNAKLATDDFRMKFETELAMRQSVEGDIAGLKTLKQEYDSTNVILLQELAGLEKQYDAVREAHQEDMKTLRGQMVGTVTVDVKEIESTDLSRVLAEIRSEYETAIEKNCQEAENWYTKQVEKKQAEVVQFTETTVSGSSEITDNRKLSLTLNMQLDAALMEKGNLEQRLVEIQSQYQAQLFSLAQLAGGLEGELASVRESALQQSRAYQLLLSTKVQLEREISTYKALIEGAGDFTVCMVKTPTVNVVPLATGGADVGVDVTVDVSSEVKSSSSSLSEAAVGGATSYAILSLEGVTDSLTAAEQP